MGSRVCEGSGGSGLRVQTGVGFRVQALRFRGFWGSV